MLAHPSNSENVPIAHGESFDLLHVPGIGNFLRWRHSRTALQIPMLLVAIIVVAHGFFGPHLAPKNLATVLTWVHFRGALVLTLLFAGNFFCFACPFVLVRDAARKFFTPRWNWPQFLRNKWLSIALLVAILFSYELFDLWSSPWWTAALIVAYFLAALAVDALFKHAAFCKFVCPIGQFNFVASLLSPLEVKIRSASVCDKCATKDCIRGQRSPVPAHANNPASAASPFVILQRGCELGLYQPLKSGNMDCTFCLDCLHACPHENIAIASRIPGTEFATDPLRSGVGHLLRRKDLAALVIAFTFGALFNAFGMVSPVYKVESALTRIFNLQHEAPALAIIFFAILVVAPALLISSAAILARALSPRPDSFTQRATRYSFVLIPLGFAMWLAHYGFHLVTGLLTIVPVTQSALRDLGLKIFGTPLWTWTGLPVRYVQPIELGFLFLGFAGSLVLVHQFAEQDDSAHPMRAFLPWAALCLLVAIASVWLMFQPMEMRATLMGG